MKHVEICLEEDFVTFIMNNVLGISNKKRKKKKSMSKKSSRSMKDLRINLKVQSRLIIINSMKLTSNKSNKVD